MGVARREATGQVFLTNVVVSLVGLDPTERLLPTPVGTDAIGARNATAERPNGNGKHRTGTTLTDVVWPGSWGQYAAAIARWEHSLGRPAPAPTVPPGGN